MNPNIPANFQVPGFIASGIAAGIKKNNQRDLALIVSQLPALAAGVFTTNRVKAAPVILSMQRIRNGSARAILINAGCANACTGRQGLADAERLSKRLAKYLEIEPESILLGSTGVIGKRLPVAVIEDSLPRLIHGLSPQGLGEAAQAMMTTDTFPKAVLQKGLIQGRRITIAGIAKGAGMISPKMATLLSFVMTDAAISLPALRRALREGVERSFNRITVDGDMSTNDTLIVLANGHAENSPIGLQGPGYEKFSTLLNGVLQTLAKMIVWDAEGATKLVQVRVQGARTEGEAETAARAVANSPLVKTAFFGNDANWGRILCALGYSGVPIDPEKIDVFFDRVQIVRRGKATGEKEDQEATAVMKQREYTLRIHLHQGRKEASIWTSDFSYDYVKINAAYRT
jgi:glutamate N-acetyltransferase/amino-acid N-acetyltransferase